MNLLGAILTLGLGSFGGADGLLTLGYATGADTPDGGGGLVATGAQGAMVG